MVVVIVADFELRQRRFDKRRLIPIKAVTHIKTPRPAADFDGDCHARDIAHAHAAGESRLQMPETA